MRFFRFIGYFIIILSTLEVSSAVIIGFMFGSLPVSLFYNIFPTVQFLQRFLRYLWIHIPNIRWFKYCN